MQRIPVVGKVKGIIWYQGCFEAAFPDEDPSTYYDRFKRMIELYRKEMAQESARNETNISDKEVLKEHPLPYSIDFRMH